MALSDISLAQFNRIASGEYNAGLVDLKTDDQGKLTGELAKVLLPVFPRRPSDRGRQRTRPGPNG